MPPSGRSLPASTTAVPGAAPVDVQRTGRHQDTGRVEPAAGSARPSTISGPTPNDYERLTGEEGDRRPPPPLSQLVEEYTALGLRNFLSRHRACLPTWDESSQPLTTQEHLRILALSEAIARRARQFRGTEVRDALQAGAGWPDVAAALGGTVADAQAGYRHWVEGQRHLHGSYDGRFGFDEHAYAEAMAWLEGPEGRA